MGGRPGVAAGLVSVVLWSACTLDIVTPRLDPSPPRLSMVVTVDEDSLSGPMRARVGAALDPGFGPDGQRALTSDAGLDFGGRTYLGVVSEDGVLAWELSAVLQGPTDSVVVVRPPDVSGESLTLWLPLAARFQPGPGDSIELGPDRTFAFEFGETPTESMSVTWGVDAREAVDQPTWLIQLRGSGTTPIVLPIPTLSLPDEPLDLDAELRAQAEFSEGAAAGYHAHVTIDFRASRRLTWAGR